MHTLFETVHSRWRKLKLAFRKKVQWRYYLTLLVFLFGYGWVFVSTFTDSSTRQYEVLDVGQSVSVGSFSYEVVNRQYDPTTSTYRLDLWLSAPDTFDYYALKFSGSIILKSDPETEYETTITPINGRYLVLTTTGIPENYDTLRQNISYGTDTVSTSSDEATTSSMTASIQLFGTEKETPVTTFETTKTSFEHDETTFEITQTTEEIAQLEDSITQNKDAIATLRSTIRTLKDDAKYQVGPELERTNRRIDDAQVTIDQTVETNNTTREKIELLHQKIDLLEEKLAQ